MPDVIVVGGGVAGLSAATYLARAGAAVTLCERGDLYEEASSKNLGFLIDLDIPAGPSRELHRRGRALFCGLPEELGVDIGLQREGAVTFGRASDGDAELFRKVYDENAADLNVELLDRGQLRELVPALRDDFDTGLFSADEAMIDNRLVCQAFAAEAQRHGAELVRGAEIVAIETAGGAVTGVRTRGGKTISADVVVLAAGTASDHLARTAGTHAPISIARSPAMITQPTAPLFGPMLWDRGHLTPSDSLRKLDLFCAGQMADGRVIFGGPMEMGPEHAVPTVDAVAAMTSALRESLPALRDVAVEGMWAGMVVLTADGLPLVGRVPECDGLLLAVGSTNTAGPAVGEMIAALARGEHPALEAELSPTRATSQHAGQGWFLSPDEQPAP